MTQITSSIDAERSLVMLGSAIRRVLPLITDTRAPRLVAERAYHL